KDSPLLLQQIEALQLSIKHLKNENNRLKGAQMKMELAGLKPLKVAKVSVAKSKQGEGLATVSLYRKTSQLLEALYHMSANAKVVDMKQTKSGRSCANAGAEASGAEHGAGRFGGDTVTLSPQDDAMREMIQQHPGASVPTDFGVFPSSSFLKAKKEEEEGMAYFGKVTVPCPPGHGQAQRVLLTPELLQQLQGHFVS
ncbi:DCTN1 protein, partial [Chauna torquata]|nr:DCTN1 protein [Chauna torquata]